jgi:hypothetical protein
MIKKMSLVMALIAATCFAGLLFAESSVVPASSAMTVGQNNNRDMGRQNGMRRRHRRHNRRWHRRHRRHNRGANMNR